MFGVWCLFRVVPTLLHPGGCALAPKAPASRLRWAAKPTFKAGCAWAQAQVALKCKRHMAPWEVAGRDGAAHRGPPGGGAAKPRPGVQAFVTSSCIWGVRLIPPACIIMFSAKHSNSCLTLSPVNKCVRPSTPSTAFNLLYFSRLLLDGLCVACNLQHTLPTRSSLRACWPLLRATTYTIVHLAGRWDHRTAAGC